MKINNEKHRKVSLTDPVASAVVQVFCTANPRKRGIKGSSSMLRKCWLLFMPGQVRAI